MAIGIGIFFFHFPGHVLKIHFIQNTLENQFAQIDEGDGHQKGGQPFNRCHERDIYRRILRGKTPQKGETNKKKAGSNPQPFVSPISDWLMSEVLVWRRTPNISPVHTRDFLQMQSTDRKDSENPQPVGRTANQRQWSQGS